MKKLLITVLSIIMILIPTLTAFAGDIPESLLHSEDSEIFFGEVIAYHPDKENPTITVSPVAMIKGDKAKEGTQQIYDDPNTIGDFKVRLDYIYLFTYFDEVNPTDIFEVTTFDTKTLKLKNVEGDMWKRFEKYINEGKYGEARIEERENPSGLLPGVIGWAVVLVLIGGICIYKKRCRKVMFGMIALVLLIGVVVVGWYVFNDIFPKAPPVRIPKVEEIHSISVAVNHEEEFEIEGVDQEELFEYIQNAEPTREISVNDYPPKDFFRIEVRTKEMEYRYFVYERGEQVYIEMPYEGIYIADRWLFDFVIRFFEE